MDLLASLAGNLRQQPVPDKDCSGLVVIVTGANRGLGLETSRHFVRLNASKVILACRDLDKAEQAKKSIEESTGRTGVVQVWQLDFSSFDSVRDFAARAAQLDRLDILLHNAGLLSVEWKDHDGHESQVTVNVLAPLLLSLLTLPTLRRTGTRFNVVPRIVIVSSDGACLTLGKELKMEHIMQTLDKPENFTFPDRYYETKLMQVMIINKLAAAVDASGKGHILVNGLTPGVVRTDLFRSMTGFGAFAIWLAGILVGRTPEMGSRTLMAAAFAGEDTHGEWMTNCAKYAPPFAMRRANGDKTTDRVWEELLTVMEELEPGVTKNM